MYIWKQKKKRWNRKKEKLERKGEYEGEREKRGGTKDTTKNKR